MRRETFRAMGTSISLLLPEKQVGRGTRLVHTLFREWEQTLSRFLPDSELSLVNQQAGIPTVVSDLLYTVLKTALMAAEATDGVYDPTLLERLVQLGYDRTFDDIPATRPASALREKPGGQWRDIKIGPLCRQVTLPIGIKLDFGGIAKGMAVDAALQRLYQENIGSALVNAGGDLAVLGHPLQEEHWQISVPGRDQFWTVPLQSGAIATSGIAHRHWRQGNALRHHLLDPRTGLPVQNDLWSVTVAADRCEQAEVAAKVAFILGSKQGGSFLRKHRIAGLFVHKDGSWETVEPWPRYLMEQEKQ